MCGIAGMVFFNEGEKETNALMGMTQQMANRGPDDEGYVLHHQNNNTICTGKKSLVSHTPISSQLETPFKWAIGFKQLKIIDLSNKSHQPMHTTDETFWLACNGELYNYKEIRKELKELGIAFKSDSDAEVMLQALVYWGIDAIEKFNGMFAFVFVDNHKNNMYLVRDRLGIKPLHYYQDSEKILFANTQSALLASGLIPRAIDWDGLWLNYRFSMSQRPLTCFENIKGLQPGHYLKIDLEKNKTNTFCYWDIPTGIQDQKMTEQEAAQLLDTALNKAVKRRLHADVPLGTFLSGGIDSSTLTAMAAQHIKHFKAITLGFENHQTLNEIQEASDTAALHPVHHKIETIHPNDILKHIETIVSLYEEPYHQISSNYVLAELAHKHNLKVVLNGLGGDELFGGYDVFNKIEAWKKLQKLKHIAPIVPGFHQKVKKAKQLASYDTYSAYYSHYYTTYSDKQISKLFQQKKTNTNEWFAQNYLRNKNFEDSFEAVSYLSLKSYIGNHQLRAVDHTTMHFGVEGRLPFLDHELVELAFKIPTKHKIAQSKQKYILRKVAEKYIAPSALKMSKKGLGLPLKDWMHKELKDFVFDHINQLKNRKLFDPKQIDLITKNYDSYQVWHLVATEIWMQKYMDQ